MQTSLLAAGALSLALSALGCSDERFNSGGTAGVGGSGGAGAAGGTGGTSGAGGSSAGTGGASGSAGTGGVVEPGLSAERYETQPMVVDVVAVMPDGVGARLELAADSGVRIGELPDTDPESRRYRLRGLSPGQDYTAELWVGEDSYPVSFTTHAPLPGFQAHFPVTLNGTPAPDYRIFDYSIANPAVADVGVFVVDSLGKTRWYFALPEATLLTDLAGIKLLPNGNLLYIADYEHVREVNELGEVQVEVTASQLGVSLFHHDVIVLPNGNYLAISLETRDIYYPADDATHFVAGDFLVEFNTAGIITWSWSALDKLDPQRKRAGFDSLFYPIFDPITGAQAKDWTHANGVIHDPSDDSLWLSLRHQDWLVKIDRATGDVVYKLGEEGDFSLDGNRWFYHPHSPELQSDGSLLLYDNGVDNPNLPSSEWQSRPMRISLDTTAMKATIEWEEVNQTYLAPIAGDVDRLSNGNLLVLDSVIPDVPGGILPGKPRLRELDPVTNTWVWTLDAPSGHFAYRAIPSVRLPGETQ